MKYPSVESPDPATTALLRALVAGVLPTEHHYGLAKSTGALPVYSDIGGTLFLHPEGFVLRVPLDPPHEPQLERDPMWCIAARVAAVRAHPELRALLPRQPAAAVSCALCFGRGVVTIGPVELGCGQCGGLGWVL